MDSEPQVEGVVPSVLFVVGMDAASSIPLELAGILAARGGNVKALALTRAGPGLETNYPGLTVTTTDRGSRSMRGWVQLFWAVLTSDAEVVHVHHTSSAFIGAIAARIRGASLVCTQHNDLKRSRGRTARALNWCTILISNVVIFNSEYTKSTLPSMLRRLLGRRTRVVYNGVDVKKIRRLSQGETSPSLGVSSNAWMIGCTARLVPQKDHETLLQAFAETKKECRSPVRLTLVGDGPLRGYLETLSRELEIENDVDFLGELSREEAFTALGTFDLFAIASKYEGFGNSIMEALAAEKPVVATSAVALVEVLGDCGRLVPIGAAADMGRAMAQTLDEKEDGKQILSDPCIRRAEGFDLSVTARCHEMIYRELH